MPVSFAFAYARPLHSDIDREEQEKYPFLSLCENMGYSLVTMRAPRIDWSQWKGDRVITLRFQSCPTLNILS